MILPFDELNVLQDKYSLPFLQELDEGVVEEEIYDLLISAFLYGVSNVNEALDVDIPVDALKGENIIHAPVAGKTWRDRLHEYFDNAFADELGEYQVMISGQQTSLSDAVSRLAECETTRVFNETMVEIALDAEKALPKGTKVLKKWITMRDERVRDTHRFLDGVEIPAAEKFHTIDGDEAMAPGGFMTATENCNCRCFLQFRKGK